MTIHAQIEQPVKWSISQEHDSVYVLTAHIDADWHLYDIELPDGGPLPTVFTYADAPIAVERLNEPLRSFDDMFQMELAYYESEASFQLPASALSADGELQVRFMACNDRSCLAPTTFTFELPKRESDMPSAGDLQSAGHGLLWIFLMGLLGGLLAIFTPCVWPIIPMTVSFFLKRSGNGLRDAMLYGVAIIVIYVSLGLLITLIFGASALNNIATNAVVNLIFFALLVLFAFSFFGAFEITLPSSWSTRLDARASSASGFLSILLMAFTLVIVSFSCTGPIIGTLLVEAAGKSLLAPTLGMLGFAIALALPFSLFAMFPQWMRRLPRSGSWMSSFKVVLAFLELALSLKFLSVADLAYGWRLLDREVFLALWIVIFGLLGVYLLGMFRFRHEEKAEGISVFRFMLAVVSLSFAIYLVPGLWGAPLKAVSAFAPPLSTQDFIVGSAPQKQHLSDLDEALQQARREDKRVLIDFSGYGCVNCRKMEGKVLTDERVKQAMERFVVVTLMVDDKTALSQPETVVENGKQITLKTVGDKWSYVQRSRFGANAQPYYVQLTQAGEQVKAAYAYSEDIEAFLNWLE